MKGVSWRLLCFRPASAVSKKSHRVFTAKNAKDLPESSFATFAEALIHVFAVFAVRPLRKTQDELFETAPVTPEHHFRTTR
jgi:hypothetical protein